MLKKIGAWIVPTAVAASLVLCPADAHAFFDEDDAYQLPPLIIAAALTTTVIILAINNPSSGEAEDDDSTADTDTTAESGSALRASHPPVYGVSFYARF